MLAAELARCHGHGFPFCSTTWSSSPSCLAADQAGVTRQQGHGDSGTCSVAA